MKFIHYGTSRWNFPRLSLPLVLPRYSRKPQEGWHHPVLGGSIVFRSRPYATTYSCARFLSWATLDDSWYKELGTDAKRNYDRARLLPPLESDAKGTPGDGELVFPNGYGGEEDHWVQGQDGYSTLHVQYHPGPEDLRFVAECDRDYLNTLLWGPERTILPNVFPDTTKLRGTEPGVWLLWLRANCPPDIGTWYMAQLEFPNIQEIVEAADRECKDWSGTQKTQYEQAAREAQAKAARRLAQLRAKLEPLIAASKNLLQPIHENQLRLLPQDELSKIQKLKSDLTNINPQSLDEAELTKAITELESLQPFLKTLPTKIAKLEELQNRKVRLTKLRAKLEPLIAASKNLLQIIHENQLRLLPQDELSKIQKLKSDLTNINPQALDEAELTKAITELESLQPFLKTLPTKIAKLQEIQDRKAREAYAKQVRLTELRAKLETLLAASKNLLQPLQEKEQLRLVPQEEQSKTQEIIRYLANIKPQALNEAELTKAINELESLQPFLKALSDKIAILIAEQETRKRIAKSRARLQFLLEEAFKILSPIEEHHQVQLLPTKEQIPLQKLIAHLKSLNLDALDEVRLNEEISFIEGNQKYLSDTQQKIAPLAAKHAKLLAKLRSKLQALVTATNKILLPIDERNEAILLPQDEGKDLQDFISHIKSLALDTLDETRLNSEIALLESKQKDLKSVQKRIAILAKERAAKVAALEKEIESLHLKVKASELAGDLKGIIENYVFIQDHYSKIAALGIDRSRELAEIDRKIKVIQGKLHTTPSPIPPSPTTPLEPTTTEALKCLIIPYAEIQLGPKLGSGAFGTVYRGLWRTETIAIKVLHSAQLTDNSKKAFLSEVDIMRKLVSERLVRLSGVCIAPDPYCIVMEYLPRGSLYSLLHSQEQYSWEVSLQIAIDIGNGLAFLQEAKIMHRDLKSLNVLLDTQYRAKICDFGLSNVRTEVTLTSTRPVTTVGTNAWNAPELFGLRPKYSFASDIYAYGMILWEILTRETPYKEVLDPNQIQIAVKAGEREEIPATCSATYRATIERCWAQLPEQRPQALQVAHALQVELDTVKLKSWHIAPELKPQGRNLEGYFLINAGAFDMQKVVAAYQRCPVPGMEVGRVTIIFNPVLNKSFADSIELLESRFGNPAFLAQYTGLYWCFKSKPPTMQEMLSKGYIFTTDSLYYFNNTIDKIKITKEKLAALKTRLEITTGDIDKPPKPLSYEQLQAIALISGHRGWRRDINLTIVDWRCEVLKRLEAMATPYQDPENKHVKILPVWHGTKAAIITSIAKGGYANLATTDVGFFGKGLYSSYEAEYAYRAYGPGKYTDGALLINWIACFSAYPVVGYQIPRYTGPVLDPGDMEQLQEKGNFQNYDAHFVPVRPKTSDPNELLYYPCRPNEPATYHEVVVFETARILPRYIVELQPTLVAAPAVAPLLAAAGMFGQKPEHEGEAPAPSPTP